MTGPAPENRKPPEAEPGQAAPDWAVAASILGLTKVLAAFPGDVEIGFRRALGLRSLLVPRDPSAQCEQDP